LVTDLMRPMADGLTQFDHIPAKQLAIRCEGHAVRALCRGAGPQISGVFCFDQIEAIETEDPSRKPI